MLVVSAELSEDELNSTLERVQRYLEAAEANVVSFKDWGLRRLAYTLRGQREGRYYLVHFLAESVKVNELDRNLRIIDGLLRHLLTRADDLDISAVQDSQDAPEETSATPAEESTNES
jgi:small subunit ribosomal protein S6